MPRTQLPNTSTGSRTDTATTYQRNTKTLFQTLSAPLSWPLAANAEQSKLTRPPAAVIGPDTHLFSFPFSSFRAGRYDSAERHCQNCPGFKEISSGQNEAFPVVITRSGYCTIKTLRMALEGMENVGDGEATELAVDSARRMLAALFKNGLPIIDCEAAQGEASGSGAIEDHNCDNTQPTAQPPTTGTGVTPEPAFDTEFLGWDCRWDTSLEINYEGEYSSSQAGGIVPVDSDHTTPTPEPIFELDLGNVKWDENGDLIFL